MTPYARARAMTRIVWECPKEGLKRTPPLMFWEAQAVLERIRQFQGRPLYLIRCYEWRRKRPSQPSHSPVQNRATK